MDLGVRNKLLDKIIDLFEGFDDSAEGASESDALESALEGGEMPEKTGKVEIMAISGGKPKMGGMGEMLEDDDDEEMLLKKKGMC